MSAVRDLLSVELDQIYRQVSGGKVYPPAIRYATEAEARRYAGLDYRTPLGGTYVYDDSRQVWVGSETFLDVGPAEPGFGWGRVSGKDAYFVSFAPHLVRFGGGVIRGVTDEQPTPPPPPSALWDNPTHLEEELIGWRGWCYASTILDDGTVEVYLQSISCGTDWKSPVQWSDSVPTEKNNAGLYAIGNEPRHQPNFGDYVAGAAVWGRVAMSGVVVEGETGYRAQRMVIQDLWVNPRLNEVSERTDSAAGLAVQLAKRFQCPVSVLAPEWTLIERKLLPEGGTHAEVAQDTEED